MSSEIKIIEEFSGETVSVAISGEIDIYTAPTLKEKLYALADNKKDMLIDCNDLGYIDSTGLGIFVGALKKTKLHGKSIKLVNLKDNIRKLFIITGLDKLFLID